MSLIHRTKIFMDNNISTRNRMLAQKVIKGLESRNMTGYYAETKEDALKQTLELIPKGSSIGWGGSVSIAEIGLKDAVCNGEQLLEMRATANQIPVAEEVMRYAMTLCSATHPDSDCASEAAKKYVRLGASPRAGQALISAAKVKALMNGRYNVSYDDINSLAYPVLRHRMKLTFEAIAERVSADEIVTMIIDELNGKKKVKSEASVANTGAEEQPAKKHKFGRK